MREIQSNSLKHPHIVEIRESFVTPNGDYVTINELAKENLAKYRQRLNTISIEKISEIMLQICLGLEYTHSRGMMHRDISPDNILIFDDEIVKICDFGLAAFG